MNKKGQALVEFIIILPILIFILLAIIDYGNISQTKNKIENILNEVSVMYKNNENDDEIKEFVNNNDSEINMNVSHDGKYINVTLYKNYDYITPGFNKIFKSDVISVERKIYYEQ